MQSTEMAGGHEIRDHREVDEAALLALRNRSFDDRMSAAHWRWRFFDNPLRETDLLATCRGDGSCVAFYGGVRLPCTIADRDGLAMNHGDVCLAPELRGSLGGSRIVAELTKRFFERSSEVVDVVWGFPVPGLLRTAARFAGIQVIRDVVMLVRDRADPLTRPGRIDVRRVGRFGADADELWTACAVTVPMALRRDAAYLNWRFLDHPSIAYEAYGAFDATSSLRGLAVVREGGWAPSILAIAEWVVPLDDTDAERALVAHVVELALARGRPVACWFPAPMQQFRRFQLDHGFYAVSTPQQEVGRWWTKSLTRRWLHENWYQTMGDMDFF